MGNIHTVGPNQALIVSGEIEDFIFVPRWPLDSWQGWMRICFDENYYFTDYKKKYILLSLFVTLTYITYLFSLDMRPTKLLGFICKTSRR